MPSLRHWLSTLYSGLIVLWLPGDALDWVSPWLVWECSLVDDEDKEVTDRTTDISSWSQGLFKIKHVRCYFSTIKYWIALLNSANLKFDAQVWVAISEANWCRFWWCRKFARRSVPWASRLGSGGQVCSLLWNLCPGWRRLGWFAKATRSSKRTLSFSSNCTVWFYYCTADFWSSTFKSWRVPTLWGQVPLSCKKGNFVWVCSFENWRQDICRDVSYL